MPDDLFKHEEICLYRQINCAVIGCKAEVGFLSYLDHIKETHSDISDAIDGKMKSSVKISYDLKFSDVQATTKSYNFKPKGFPAFNQTFFAMSTIQDGIFYNWVYILEDPTQAEHFIIEVKMEDGNSKSMTFKEGVNSLDLSHEKIIEDEINVFSFTVKTALKYVQNDHLNILVKIRNLKEEAKDEDQESGISDNDE